MPAPVLLRPLLLLPLYDGRPRPLDRVPMPAPVLLRLPLLPLRLRLPYDRRPRPLDGVPMPAPVLLQLLLLLLRYARRSRPLDGVPCRGAVSAHRMTVCAEVMLLSPRGACRSVAVATSNRCNPSIAPVTLATSAGDGPRTDRSSPFAPSIAAAPSVRGRSTSDRNNPLTVAGTPVAMGGRRDGT